MTIDGKFVHFPENLGLVINGNHNTTLTFKSNIFNLRVQTNFWLIKSNLCSNKSSFLFGAEEMEFNITSYTSICVFSPFFDSQNEIFEISFGSNSIFGSYFMDLYTTNVNVPFVKEFGNNSNIYKIKGPFFVNFKTNDFDQFCYPSDFFFYTRKTKVKKGDYFENFCQMNYMTECNSSLCHDDSSIMAKWSCSM